MPFLDDERLRYPIEYINMVGGRISNLKPVPGKDDLVTFTFVSQAGFSIFCQARIDLTTNIKEGVIKAGTASGMLKFAIPDNKDITGTRIFMTVEEWENVVIE